MGALYTFKDLGDLATHLDGLAANSRALQKGAAAGDLFRVSARMHGAEAQAIERIANMLRHSKLEGAQDAISADPLAFAPGDSAPYSNEAETAQGLPAAEVQSTDVTSRWVRDSGYAYDVSVKLLSGGCLRLCCWDVERAVQLRNAVREAVGSVEYDPPQE